MATLRYAGSTLGVI